jgi:hypothetical protein
MQKFDLSAVIPILGGIWGYLLALQIIPRNPKDPEKWEEWHQKHGGLMKFLSPILIVFGVLRFFRIL